MIKGTFVILSFTHFKCHLKKAAYSSFRKAYLIDRFVHGHNKTQLENKTLNILIIKHDCISTMHGNILIGELSRFQLQRLLSINTKKITTFFNEWDRSYRTEIKTI